MELISEVPLRPCKSSHAMSRKIKSLTKIFDLMAAKETSPFTAHCKKDMLEWLRVPRWPFAVFFYHLAKKKEKDGNIAKVLIILHHLTKFITHSWERLKIRYESLRNIAMHFKEFKSVKNAFYSSAAVRRASQAPIFSRACFSRARL